MHLWFLALWNLLAAEGPAATGTVVARVNDTPIYLSELDYVIRRTYPSRKLADRALRRLRPWALETTVRRVVILEHLDRTGQAVSEEELEATIREFRQRLKSNRLSFQRHLEKIGLSEEQFRRAMDWQLSWSRFLARELSEEKLRSYFRRHQAHFDGTQVRVAHLFLKLPPSDPEAAKRQEQLARSIYHQIRSGQLTFEQAVQRYSQGTRAQAGELGWIERHGSMPEPFAQAAFELRVGQVSPPVKTRMGIHLIRLLDVRPGNKRFEEVREEVRRAAAQELFLSLSNRLLSQAQVQLLGPVPWPSQSPLSRRFR